MRACVYPSTQGRHPSIEGDPHDRRQRRNERTDRERGRGRTYPNTIAGVLLLLAEVGELNVRSDVAGKLRDVAEAAHAWCARLPRGTRACLPRGHRRVRLRGHVAIVFCRVRCVSAREAIAETTDGDGPGNESPVALALYGRWAVCDFPYLAGGDELAALLDSLAGLPIRLQERLSDG